MSIAKMKTKPAKFSIEKHREISACLVRLSNIENSEFRAELACEIDGENLDGWFF